MNKLLLTSITAMVSTTFADQNEFELEPLTHSNMIQLTEETFYEQIVNAGSGGSFLKTEKPWFVNFYAPWCGHS